jgi:lysophospholipase L1-like esterase
MEQHLLPLSALALGAVTLAVGCAGKQRPSSTPLGAEPTTQPGAQRGSAPLSQDAPVRSSELAAPRTSTESTKTEHDANMADPSASASEPATLPRGTLVLHVGDSFAGALGVPLGHRLKALGLRSVLEYQTSSYVPTWASGTELPGYVSKYNPDLVIITLGANEFELSAPGTRAGAVRRLVQHLGHRPCVWVTPPRWKQDTGILAVIRDNVRPCRFLDSDTVVHDLGRKPDKIHPSDPAREQWADAVLAWLTRERRGSTEHPWEFREETP